MVADPLVSEHQIMENGNVFEKKKIVKQRSLVWRYFFLNIFLLLHTEISKADAVKYFAQKKS